MGNLLRTEWRYRNLILLLLYSFLYDALWTMGRRLFPGAPIFVWTWVESRRRQRRRRRSAAGRCGWSRWGWPLPTPSSKRPHWTWRLASWSTLPSTSSTHERRQRGFLYYTLADWRPRCVRVRLTRWIQRRFDCRSTPIRPRYDHSMQGCAHDFSFGGESRPKAESGGGVPLQLEGLGNAVSSSAGSGRSVDRPKVPTIFSTQEGLSWHYNTVKC